MNDEYADYSFNGVTDDENDLMAPFDPPKKQKKEEKKSRFAGRKIPVKGGDILKNRTNAQARESAKLSQFVKVLHELNPMFSSVKKLSQGNDEKFKKDISEAFKNQKELVETLALSWGLTESKINDRFIISHISKSVSELLSNGEISSFTKDDALIIGKCISEIHNDKLIFGELLESSLISEDVVVNIKAAMMEPSVKLGKLMDDLMVSKIEQQKIYYLFHNITYELSQDLAFNWDRHALVSDRESLFVNIMSCCADVVITSLKEHIVEILAQDSIVLEQSIIWSWMGELNKKIIENDMGYLHCSDTDIYWLKDQLATLMISRLNDIECPFFNNLEKNLIQGYFLNIFEKALIESWEEEAEKKMSELQSIINKTPEDEHEELFKSEEFRRPMELKGLFNRFSNKTKINLSLIESGFDEEKVKRVSSKNFAMFWGLSNAVCKLRV